MAPIVSEILKITIDPAKFDLSSPEFAKLRDAASQGGAKEQYYGLCTDEPDKLLWVLNWPGSISPAEFKATPESEAFRASVKALDKNSNPSSWFIPLESADLIRPALTAPVCQLCCLHLGPAAPVAELGGSLHKTFTDCYHAKGFTGGHWGAALNDKNQNYYYLGWESRELHDEFAKTDLFWVEMNNLLPHTNEGTGTNYMKMTPHLG